MQSVTDTLMAFLHARLDDDERVARAAQEETGARWTPGEQLPMPGSVNDAESGAVIVVGPGGHHLDWGPRHHIARHDPARVLREVEAKRRRLARHAPERRRLTLTDDTGATSLAFYVCTWCTPNRLIEQGQAVVEWPCPDVRDDVAAYADHTGYREEWRP